MPRRFRHAGRLVGVLVVALLACRSSAAVTGAVPRAQAPGAELVIGRAQYETTVEVVVGQRFRVARPAGAERWQVAYADEVIRLVDPPEDRTRPGPAGWRFEAVADGETAVTLTSVSAGEAPPREFTFTIRVKAPGDRGAGAVSWARWREP